MLNVKPNTLSVSSRQWELRMTITLRGGKKKKKDYLNCGKNELYFHHFVTCIKLEIWKCLHMI